MTIVGSRRPERLRPAGRRELARELGRAGSRGQRHGARDRRRRAPGRPRGRRDDDRRARATGPTSPTRRVNAASTSGSSRPAPRSPSTRRGPRPRRRPFPGPQPDHGRARRSGGDRRGGAALGLADHRRSGAATSGATSARCRARSASRVAAGTNDLIATAPYLIRDARDVLDAAARASACATARPHRPAARAASCAAVLDAVERGGGDGRRGRARGGLEPREAAVGAGPARAARLRRAPTPLGALRAHGRWPRRR